MYGRAYVEITNSCNLNCSFCHGHKRRKRFMNLGEFSRILEQLEGKTRYIYYHLMGEPLLHPMLPDFLEMAKEKGFFSVITTNGTILPEAGERILAAGVHKVSISLHSFEEGERMELERYIENIAAFAEKARAAGVIVSLRLWNRGADSDCNDDIEELLQWYFPQQWTENSKGYRIDDKLFLEYGDRFAWPDKDAPVQEGKVFCYGLRDQFGILVDGTVVPCCLDSEGVIDLGNIFTQELSDILSTQRAKSIAEGFRCGKAEEDLCRRCGFAQRFQ